MGIYKPNPITDFVQEPPRKRQKIVYHGPWWEPSTRTMRIVSTGRDLEYRRLRKERLIKGFNHWRKLSYMEYPKLNHAKLTDGLKSFAKEIRLHREY